MNLFLVQGAPFPDCCGWPCRESLSRPFSTAICSIPFKPRLRSFQNHPKSSFLDLFYDLKMTTSGLSRFCRKSFLTSNFGKCQGAGVSIQNSKLREKQLKFMNLQKLSKKIKQRSRTVLQKLSRRNRDLRAIGLVHNFHIFFNKWALLCGVFF